MQWHDTGFVLAARRHGESALIVEARLVASWCGPMPRVFSTIPAGSLV